MKILNYAIEREDADQFIQTIKFDFKREFPDSLIESTTRDGITWINIFIEVYFFRTNSTAGISISLLGDSRKIEVVAASLGAGGGIFDLSWGAQDKSVKGVHRFFESHGFTKTSY